MDTVVIGVIIALAGTLMGAMLVFGYLGYKFFQTIKGKG